MDNFIKKTSDMNQHDKQNQTLNIYNVVILDKSGSMSSIRREAVNGFNETLGSIRASQKQYADTQKHFVSLYAFCGCGVEVLIEDEPIEKVENLKYDDYKPCCMTPLFDAMGLVFTRYKVMLPTVEDGIVAATIITDGMENASTDYNSRSISALIDSLKERGWLFSYIGANQDAHKVAATMSIDNAMNFVSDSNGTQAMFMAERTSRAKHSKRLACFMADESPEMSSKERAKKLSELNKDYFE